ncbi:hypothetical protein CYLTODRAFT_379376 [Cylindrobasidium torrendii FP15055 ss-10]|uniref:NAD(P)-binding domain-containing protein n=1 Tax=Cylindrobasidium torrendii FP15055 ss-10 TaxID=1314674 RepID=A0A0D7B4K6_9AGAR|nr:hypothetical protein CYLTODRAFT_379376 [Cylindrobasidium torrendii FP15055 ss-10]
MKLLLSGSTGAAGSQILRSAIADPDVSSITILSRRPLPSWLPVPNDSKPTEVVILKDFMDYPPEIAKKLADHDACIWALGTSSIGMSEEAYTKVTYDYVVKAVEAIQAGGIKDSTHAKPFRFVFISGEGSDQERQDIAMFGRVKGRTEKFLTSLPPDSNIKGSIFRPAYFFPAHPNDRANTRGLLLRGLDCIAAPIFRTVVPKLYTPISDLGRFSVELAKGRWAEEHTFPNAKMRELIAQL